MKKFLSMFVITAMLLSNLSITSASETAKIIESSFDDIWEEDSDVYDPGFIEPGADGPSCNGVHDGTEARWEETVREATCTTGAEVLYGCIDCGVQLGSYTTEPLGHAWGSVYIAQESDCTHEGVLTTTCARCGETKNTTLPALGHEWSGWQEVSVGSCTEPGIMRNTCRKCGQTEDQTTAAASHDLTGWREVKEATCTEEGLRRNSCSRCSYKEEETIKPLGHDYGEWEVDEEPTEDKEGTEKRECKRCDHTETRTIDKKEKEEAEAKPGDAVRLLLVERSTPLKGYYTEGDSRVVLDVIVANVGSSPVTDLRVTTPLLEPGEYDESSVDSLQPGEIQVIGLTYDFAILEDSGETDNGDIESVDDMVPVDDTMGADDIGDAEGVETEDGIEIIDDTADSDIPLPYNPSFRASVTYVCEDTEGYAVSNEIGVRYDVPDPLRESALTLTLETPELPECGYYTENSTLFVTGTAESQEKCWDVTVSVDGNDVNSHVSSVDAENAGTFRIPVTITAADCERGSRTVMADGSFLSGNGAFGTAVSNTVEIPCGRPAEAAGVLTLKELSRPQNFSGKYAAGESAFYTEGELVAFGLELYDETADLSGQPVDPAGVQLSMNTPAAVPVENLTAAGASVGTVWYYEVTAEDAARGYLDASATADCVASDGSSIAVTSNTLKIACGSDNTALWCELSAVTVPANGSYYTPGEKVLYLQYTMNCGENPISNLEVNSLYAMSGAAELLEPDSGYSSYFSYEVTAEDAEAGFALMQCLAEGEGAGAVSNVVRVPVGGGEQNNTASLSIYEIKAPDCTPANGSRFTVGEEIVYYVYIKNLTGNELTDVKVTSSRNSDLEEVLATIAPGKTATVVFKDTATEADAANDGAVSAAIVTWDDGEAHTMVSNMVYAPVDAEAAATVMNCCTLKLSGIGEDAYQYNQHYCLRHTGLETEGAWRNAVEELYDEWFRQLSGTECRAAALDRAAFLRMLDAFEEAGNTWLAGGEEQTREEVLKLLKNKCAELCYEIHTTPAGFPDHWTQKADFMELVSGGNCSLYTESTSENTWTYTENYCAAHADVLNRALESLGNVQGEVSAESFLAEMALENCMRNTFDSICAGLDSAQTESLWKDYTACSEYLAQRETTLRFFRRGDEAVIGQENCRGLMDRILFNCEESTL